MMRKKRISLIETQFHSTQLTFVDKQYINRYGIDIKNVIMYDVLSYLESIRGSIPFHTQTATLYSV